MKNPVGSTVKQHVLPEAFPLGLEVGFTAIAVPVGCGFCSGLRCSPPRCPCSSLRHVFA